MICSIKLPFKTFLRIHAATFGESIFCKLMHSWQIPCLCSSSVPFVSLLEIAFCIKTSAQQSCRYAASVFCLFAKRRFKKLGVFLGAKIRFL